MYASAIAQGERNAKAIPLIKAHCSHARVELSEVHGYAPLEDMTGLPISVREMRCQYAPAPVSVSTDLLRGAIAFYENNCVGCPHRDAQGLPNLKTVAEEAMEQRRNERATQEAAAATAAENGSSEPLRGLSVRLASHPLPAR